MAAAAARAFSSSTCSGATGAAAAGGGVWCHARPAGAAASGSLERGGRGPSSSSVVSPPAVGGFQLAGEAVWGESMFSQGKGKGCQKAVWLGVAEPQRP